MQLPDAAMKLAPTGTTIMVRSDGSNPALFESLRRVNKQMNAEQVIYGAQTMEELISESLAARRFAMILLAVFAAWRWFLRAWASTALFPTLWASALTRSECASRWARAAGMF